MTEVLTEQWTTYIRIAKPHCVRIGVRTVIGEDRLTPRERQAFALAQRGLPLKRIATEMGVSTSTAGDHVRACRIKCGMGLHALRARGVRSLLDRIERLERALADAGIEVPK